jgi:hypothetical protein
MTNRDDQPFTAKLEGVSPGLVILKQLVALLDADRSTVVGEGATG